MTTLKVEGVYPMAYETFEDVATELHLACRSSAHAAPPGETGQLYLIPTLCDPSAQLD
jgi:hypothetical protein